jgi:lipoprotein signal peptidase
MRGLGTDGGNVTDFPNIGVGPVRTGIFNLADMALMLGLALLVVGDMFGPRPAKAWRSRTGLRH